MIAGCTFLSKEKRSVTLTRFRAHAYWRRSQLRIYLVALVVNAYSDRIRRVRSRSHAKSRFLKIISVRRYDSECFVGEQTAGTRVNTHIHICMYLCRCDNIFHPGHFTISQLLSFCISSTAASNSNVFYTSIEILIWLSPLCCARVCFAQVTYQSARSPSITASLYQLS